MVYLAPQVPSDVKNEPLLHWVSAPSPLMVRHGPWCQRNNSNRCGHCLRRQDSMAMGADRIHRKGVDHGVLGLPSRVPRIPHVDRPSVTPLTCRYRACQSLAGRTTHGKWISSETMWACG